MHRGGTSSCSYDYESWDNKPLKRRDSCQSPPKYSRSVYWEDHQREVDRYRAWSSYEYHKLVEERRKHEEEAYQWRCKQALKKPSPSPKRSVPKSSSSSKPNSTELDLDKRLTKLLDKLNEFERMYKASITPSPSQELVAKESIGTCEVPKQELIIPSKEDQEDLKSYTLTFTLFSVSSFVQVHQSQVKMILTSSIPKSFIEFTTFHGVAVLSVVSLCRGIMQDFHCRSLPPLLEHREQMVPFKVPISKPHVLLPYSSSTYFLKLHSSQVEFIVFLANEKVERDFQ